MGDPRGFLTHDRALPDSRPVEERILDYREIYTESSNDLVLNQAARCMDCGIPFCHNGCPLGNIIPEFNDAVHNEDWFLAYKILASTNNFPEFTGRICPAPCEASCVLGINQKPVAIEFIEKQIAEVAFSKGYIKPNPPAVRTGKSVAIIGSGPAGLAAAAQLNKVGHYVTVYERNDRIGGLLRYGIPDFKLEKTVLDRRLRIMESEGIKFRTSSNIGVDIHVSEIYQEFDAILLAGGSTVARDLPIEGRNLKGIHLAMDYLEQSNRRVAGETINPEEIIHAKGKKVCVIGGGDTGSDCIGTANRHGAESIIQIELLSKPPEERDESTPWPLWPMQIRTSSSHEEGCDRHWSIMTKRFIGDETGVLKGIEVVDLEWKKNPKTSKYSFQEIEGSARQLPCDQVFLAIGFLYPKQDGILAQLNLALDDRGNVKANNYETSKQGVYVAGDMRRGQSLVVWAISEGREAARAIDEYLSGNSSLEGKEVSNYLVAGY